MSRLLPDATEHDEAISALWPVMWEQAQTNRARRNELRRSYRTHLVMKKMRADGSSCATCVYFSPLGKPPGPHQITCLLHSDAEHISPTTGEGLCNHWKPTEGPST